MRGTQDTQIWQKLGPVYCAKGEAPWRTSHAYIPTAFLLSPERIRVIVAFLDQAHMGRIGYVDVDASDPRRVIEVSPNPCLDLGRPGAFDEHGVSPLSILRSGQDLYLYYAGWQRSESVRYFLFTGLAKSVDGGATFARLSEAPLLDRCDGELLVRSGGFVFPFEGDWLFLYMGGSAHAEVGGKSTPTYDLMALRSNSLVTWAGPGRRTLAPNRPSEFGFGRPWIIVEDGRCRMWLSVRSVARGYFLGYAESADGLHWTRNDEMLQLEGTQDSWDSETRSCASIVDTATGRYMFYNGNGYGATGFGVARLVRDGTRL